MSPRRLKGGSSNANAAIELSELAAGVADAVLRAKLRLDQHAVAIANEYKASRVLSVLSPPAFAIGEVRITIKFAIAQVERPAPTKRGIKGSPIRIHVQVAAASLAEIAPNAISEIELRIAPEMKRAQSTEEDSGSLE